MPHATPQGKTTIEGMRCVVDDDNKGLTDLVKSGHQWHVLSSETPDEVASEISAWLNSSNNSAQVSHEVEHLRCLQRVCLREMEKAGSAQLAPLMMSGRVGAVDLPEHA